MQSNVIYNPLLSMTATQYAAVANQYIGYQLFPVLSVGQQAAGYFVFKSENMINIPKLIARAPATQYSRGKFILDNATFNTRDYGHEEAVDDRERKKYRFAIDADTAAVTRAMRVVLVNQEERVRALACDTTKVANSAVGTKWDAANSDPVGDVNVAREVIRINCGVVPNTMTITEPTFNILAEHPKVLDKIKYTQRGVVTEDLLAAVFKVQKLLVARTVASASNEGQPVTPADIWGKICLLSYTDGSPDLKAPTFGRVFSCAEEVGADGVIVESYREDGIRGDVHRVRNDADEELVAPGAGYLLTSVIS